ncbi:hypothetical protein POM88_037747 [Heracleum sosnowskyi]|uniref:Beta-galactosidase galactose-binding domain-containing protein n=1 Tax=Heracleum sosnowskyi TaxID=360622 RepID=A0AAD8MDK2_9APIA|nr:hypothetical protein POM88_037747 [Heracleum sosnowskyi]
MEKEKLKKESLKLSQKESDRFNPVYAFPGDTVILVGFSIYLEAFIYNKGSHKLCGYHEAVHRICFTMAEAKLRHLLVDLGNADEIVGIQNVGTHFERWNAEVLGPVTLNGLNEGRRDLTWQKWSYQVGLNGEALGLHSLTGSSTSEWSEGSVLLMTWYKTTFNAPVGNHPLALDMNTMSKGQVWITGKSIGRYWPVYKASGTCSQCSHTGWFNEKKCQSNCGEASQRWYHVPRSWLKPTGNLLVLFEELGGNPYGITLAKREVASVCADIYESQPTLMNYEMQHSSKM